MSKNIIITGGAKGIGRGIAEKFLKESYEVFIVDMDEEQGHAFAKLSDKAHFIKADLSVASDVSFLFEQLKDQQITIDILINNVGISEFKNILEMSVDDWDRILNTNLRSAFIASREFAKQQSLDSYGRIINIASTRHLMSEPNGEAYAASKGGLVSLTHALAISLQRKGMTVNCISPGWIDTEHYGTLSPEDHLQHPSMRVGIPDDVANLCLFLCQPENDFMTGQNFYVDGGMTKKMIYV